MKNQDFIKMFMLYQSSRNLSRAMSEAGRERALRLFSIDEMVQKYRGLYLEDPAGSR